MSTTRREARWPAPLSARVNHSLLASALICCSMMTVIRIRNIQDSNPFGCAPFVVIVFYDAVLLFLTSKEAKVESEGRRALVVSTDDGQGQAEKDDEKDEGIVAIAHLRQTLNFWVCAVCQSGIAASVLYEAGRLALLLRAPTMLTLPGILTGCIDLLASVGQIGVLSYVTLWAIVLQINIGSYLDTEIFERDLEESD